METKQDTCLGEYKYDKRHHYPQKILTLVEEIYMYTITCNSRQNEKRTSNDVQSLRF